MIKSRNRSHNNLLEAAEEEYIWDDNTLLFRNREAEIRDRLGSPIDMDEFGAVTVASVLGFTGYMYDDVSGTYFAQAREYMPEAGRFAGRDIVKGTILQPLTLNNYHYCHSNPIGFVDYDGMKEKTANDYINGGTRGGAENVGGRLVEEAGKRGGKSVAVKLADKTMENARKNFGIELAKRIDNPDMGTRVLTNITDDATSKLRSYGSIGSKAGTAGKLVGGGITVGLEVGLGYMEDKAADRSSSKILSNAGVNAGYALAGLGVSAVATLFVASGLVALGVAAGPAGWAVLAIVGVAWGAWTVFSSDTVKDWINSLD